MPDIIGGLGDQDTLNVGDDWTITPSTTTDIPESDYVEEFVEQVEISTTPQQNPLEQSQED